LRRGIVEQSLTLGFAPIVVAETPVLEDPETPSPAVAQEADPPKRPRSRKSKATQPADSPPPESTPAPPPQPKRARKSASDEALVPPASESGSPDVEEAAQKPKRRTRKPEATPSVVAVAEAPSMPPADKPRRRAKKAE
jgi:ribonuclease E